MKDTPLDRLTCADFTAQTKTIFRVPVDARDWVELELTEVTPARVSETGGAKSVAYENFALLFLGPADRLLPQGIYWFESVTLGRFELFIVPVGRDAKGIQYQALFNRLVGRGTVQ
jgi:hypothetical protein